MEIWRDIKGYEGLYQVSNKGRVRSLDHYVNNRGRQYFVSGRILRQTHNSKGYKQLTISVNGVQVSKKIHRLVAEAFIPNPDNKPAVNHKDEDKTNNCSENLEWMTNKENNDYSGTIEKWQKAGWKKAREVNRKPIELYENGELVGVFPSIIECANEKGFKKSSISNVLSGRSKTLYGIYTFKYQSE